jgi:hypothetical protein
LIVLEAELGSLSFKEPVASCLSFPTRPISLKRSSITLDIVKNSRRGRTITVQCLDSNTSRFKQKQFKYKERNDNYGWTKNDNINGDNKKNIKY